MEELGEDFGSEDEDDDEDDNGDDGEEEESDGGEEENTPGEEIADNTVQSNEEKLDQGEKNGEKLNLNEDLHHETEEVPEEQDRVENVNEDDTGTHEDIKEPSEEVQNTGGVVENGVCESVQPGEGLGEENDVNGADSEENSGFIVNHEEDTEGQLEGKTVQEGTIQDEKGVEITVELGVV